MSCFFSLLFFFCINCPITLFLFFSILWYRDVYLNYALFKIFLFFLGEFSHKYRMCYGRVEQKDRRNPSCSKEPTEFYLGGGTEELPKRMWVQIKEEVEGKYSDWESKNKCCKYTYILEIQILNNFL